MERARPGFASVGVLAALTLAAAASPPAAVPAAAPTPPRRTPLAMREPHGGGAHGRGHLDDHDPKRVDAAQAKRERKANRRIREALIAERRR